MSTTATCPEYKTWQGDVGNLHWSDLLVIIVYFLGVIAVGIWSSFKNRGSVEGWFTTANNRDGRTGSLARSLAPLTHFLAPPCSRAPMRSFVRSLSHSRARGKVGMIRCFKIRLL